MTVMSVTEEERELIVHMRKTYGFNRPKKINKQACEFLWRKNVETSNELKHRLKNMSIHDKMYQPLLDHIMYCDMRIMQFAQMLDYLRKEENLKNESN